MCRVNALYGWTSRGLYEYDLAVIYIGTSRSDLGRFSVVNSSSYSARRMWTAGYPADKSPGTTMWRASCMMSDKNSTDRVSGAT